MTRSPVHHLVKKYLQNSAHPLVNNLGGLGGLGEYEHLAVIPLYNELDKLPEMVANMEAVDQGAVLVIVVVNNKSSDPPEMLHAGQRTLDWFRQRMQALTPVGQMQVLAEEGSRKHWLLVDATTDGRRLSPKQGVGWARKLGCDLACGLALEGFWRGRFIHTTDADARWPSDYFRQAADSDGHLFLYDFHHYYPEAASELLCQAVDFYDLWLRYYRSEMQRIGSRYAHYTIGSLIAVDYGCYSQVRGFNDRLAGEDFYLINKVIKMSPVVQAQGQLKVGLEGRPSQRVPFGTGQGVRSIHETLSCGLEYRTIARANFTALGRLLEAVETYGRDFHQQLDLPAELIDPVKAQFTKLSKYGPKQQLLRFHDAFDGLRQLQWLRLARQCLYPDVLAQEVFREYRDQWV